MSGLLLLLGISLVLLVLLSAFFSSSEVAYFALNPLDVRRMVSEKPRRGRQVEKILSDRTRLLSTILIGNTLVNIAIPTVLYSLVMNLGGQQAAGIAMAASFFLLLVFGELGPKRIAVNKPAQTALLYAPMLQGITLVLTPLRMLTEAATRVFSKRLFTPRNRALSDEELETAVELGEEQGVLDEEEKEMLKGIISLENLRASDVMTPRVDILGIDLDDPDEPIEQVAARARVRKLVLYRGSLDHVVGLLDIRKYLLDPERNLARATKTTMYVPEANPLDRLLNRFLQEHRRTAIVVDEYGGTAGVITRGDIIEEIVGDIDDEKGRHDLLFDQIGPGRWIMDGRLNLETLGETIEYAFAEEGVDRISGWITNRLERIPRPGDRVEEDDLVFTVRQMRRHRITLVELIDRRKPE